MQRRITAVAVLALALAYVLPEGFGGRVAAQEPEQASHLAGGVQTPADGLQTPPDSPREARIRELFSERAEQRSQTAATKKTTAAAEEVNSGSVLNMLKGLGLCLGIFLIGTYLVKRTKGPQLYSGKRKLKIIERMPISTKSCLVLVAVANKEILLSVGSDRVSVVDGGFEFEQEFSSVEAQNEPPR